MPLAKAKCQICGIEQRSLFMHIAVAHHLKPDDYRLKFPSALLHGSEGKHKYKGTVHGSKGQSKGRSKSPETKQKLSKARLGRKFSPHAPETIAKMEAAWVCRKADKETYAAYIQSVSERQSRPEAKALLRERTLQNIKNGTHNGKSSNTKPERMMKAFLEKNHVAYEHQYILETTKGSWIFDFYLPEMNMLVETDSQYYHTKSMEVANRDAMKERLATDLGYVVARISDKNWKPEIIFADHDVIKQSSETLRQKHLDMISMRLAAAA